MFIQGIRCFTRMGFAGGAFWPDLFFGEGNVLACWRTDHLRQVLVKEAAVVFGEHITELGASPFAAQRTPTDSASCLHRVGHRRRQSRFR